MSYSWSKSVLPIAAIFCFRMLGIFMLIPIFTVFAAELQHSTPTLIGIALGSYGLSQGLLQIPFGILSDRFGRKKIIAIGLVLFALGSLIGMFSHSIYSMIAARILQGAGAIGSVLIALLADLTPDEQRTKAMAVIGMAIGLSFSLAMVISPVIAQHYGLSGIFSFTALLACLGLIILYRVIPTLKKQRFHTDSETRVSLLKITLFNKHLQRLNLGIFIQHFILTATFYVIPLLLQEQLKLGNLVYTWSFYLPLMLGSFILMTPFIYFAEKKKLIKPIFLVAILISCGSQLLLALIYNQWLSLCGLMLVYFIAFNFLEANLPSLISKEANAVNKGTAMGIYSSCQFLGIFIGGFSAGLLYQYAGTHAIFIVNAVLGLIWFFVALRMSANLYHLTLILKKPDHIHSEAIVFKALKDLSGVLEVSMVDEEKTIYLRVNKQFYHPGSAEKILQDAQNTGLLI